MNVWKVLENTYYDSVTLMSLTARLKKEMPFSELVMLMGTEMNKVMIKDIDLMNSDVEQASPNDLILVASLSDGSLLETWDQVVVSELTSKKKNTSSTEKDYKTIHQAAKEFEGNMVVISVPGPYAANEAYNALENNMHVMLFSDNVSVEDEINLKKLAIQKDLLLMGPDCGTAIINGKGLCFANSVRDGQVGLVAASGTGLQEVSVLIDRNGGGISQAIGVGGRDLKEEVGGLMMLKGIDLLNRDDGTKVIVLISKPPHKSVQEKIIKKLEEVHKKVVICFLDSLPVEGLGDHIEFTSTLAEAADAALRLMDLTSHILEPIRPDISQQITGAKAQLSPTQTKLKGLYCGGTLTAEALSIVRKDLVGTTSNVAKKEDEKMADCFVSEGHNLVDLGDDVFTQGRPHPMIEPTIRLERIIKEAMNPETGALLLDFELGFGSHDDPVGITVDTLKEASQIAKEDGRYLPIIGYVLGTENDKQDLQKQEQQLRDIGVIVAKSNASACRIAVELLKEVQ